MKIRRLLVVPFMCALGAFASIGGATSAGAWDSTSGTDCTIVPIPDFVDQYDSPFQSSVAAVVQVECNPVFAHQTVTITSNELLASCQGNLSWRRAVGGYSEGSSITVPLDDAGNANVAAWGGPNCAPATSTIFVSLNAPPYSTVSTDFNVLPPQTTTEGITATPDTQVEDSTASSVITVLQVEFPTTYADQFVTISSSELHAACSTLTWTGPDEIPATPGTDRATVRVDNDGNAFVVVSGLFCIPGTYTINAGPLVGPSAYSNTFTILPPQQTF